jgi:uroporphyrinogen-III decarboxylase
MKTPQELVRERTARIQTAAALGKTDRVPVVLFGDAFCANHLGVKMSEYSNNPELATKTMIQSLTSLGEIDATEMVTTPAHLLSCMALTDMKIAGRDLPEGMVWQLDEYGTMKVEDYDTILDKGYEAVKMDIIVNRLRDKELMKKVQEVLEYMPVATKAWADQGIPLFFPFLTVAPYDLLIGARTMPAFTKDLFKIPDKVEAVMKIIQAETMELVRNQIRALKPLCVFLGNARGSGEFVSPKISQRFVWPYIKQMVELISEEGVIPYLHFDSNWDRDLDHFLDLPKGKCIVSSDSATNIFKMKEKLDGHMCLMGDVPAALLTLGTPDEVYKHCTNRINEIGPTGYILAQSCTIPANAKPENVRAMISAATGK